MPERIDIRLVLPEELSRRLRLYVDKTFGGQKGAITLTITQALKEFLDSQYEELPTPPVRTKR